MFGWVHLLVGEAAAASVGVYEREDRLVHAHSGADLDLALDVYDYQQTRILNPFRLVWMVWLRSKGA